MDCVGDILGVLAIDSAVTELRCFRIDLWGVVGVSCVDAQPDVVSEDDLDLFATSLSLILLFKDDIHMSCSMTAKRPISMHWLSQLDLGLLMSPSDTYQSFIG